MNILIFAGYYYPHIGGYEKNIHELSKRLVIKGHKVKILTCNTEKSNGYEIKDNVIIERLSCWHLLGNTFPVPIPNLKLFNYSADIFITQTRFFPICLLGLMLSIFKRKPLIHVERGTCHSVVDNSIVNKIAKIYDHTIGALIVKRAKVNVGVSKSACKFVEHLGSNKTQVIYNGIASDKYPIDGLSRLMKDNVRIIIFVGRLIYAKGVQDLIEAFCIVKEKHLDLQLIIVGDGNYRSELEKLASEQKYDRDIKFLGQKNSNEISQLLSISTIFVNPSYSEGLPTSVMEAASFGLPIIATDVGGTNEIIEQCKSGILVKPHNVKQLADELDILLSCEKEIALPIGSEAYKRVNQKFNWDEITNQWIQLLNRVDKGKDAYTEYME